jgi:hypothetical protein
LVEALWHDLILPFIERHVAGTPYQAILDEYLRDNAVDNIYEGRWDDDPRQLSLYFDDRAGMCGMSSEAADHWLELALSARARELLLLGRHYGYRLAYWRNAERGSPTPASALATALEQGPRYSLVLLRGRVYCVDRKGPETRNGVSYLWTDEVPDQVSFEDLEPAEKRQARRAARRCSCPLCVALRKAPRANAIRANERLRRSIQQTLEHRLALGEVVERHAERFQALDPRLSLKDLQALSRVRRQSALIRALAPRALDADDVGSLADRIACSSEDPRDLADLDSVQFAERHPELLGLQNILSQTPRGREKLNRLSRLRSLRALWLFGNRITRLGVDFTLLTRLELLDLSENELTELPESLVHCVKLASLDVSHNQLPSLPDWLSQLTRLKSLRVGGNPLQAGEVERICRALPGCRVV